MQCPEVGRYLKAGISRLSYFVGRLFIDVKNFWDELRLTTGVTTESDDIRTFPRLRLGRRHMHLFVCNVERC